MAVVGTGRQSLVERMKGAAMLDIHTYEAVEADRTATTQAATVVAIVAVAQGIGAASMGPAGVVASIVLALLSWLAWAGITYVIGDKLFGGTATWGELMRTLGFAQSPGVLAVFAIVPFLGGLIHFAVAIWVLVTAIVAIRQALDFSTGKAILTAIVGWLLLALPLALLGAIVS